MAELNTETTTPVAGATVDGGSARNAEATMTQTPASQKTAGDPYNAGTQATDWQKSYQTMQTNYNRLHEEFKAKDAQLAEVNTQLATMQQQLSTLTGEKQALASTTEQLTAQTTELQGKYTSTQAQLDMYKMVAETPEFRILAPITGTLKPGESAESTREMLQVMAQAIGAVANSEVARQMEGVIPSGNFQRGGAALSAEQLFKAATAPGATREDIDAYYAVVSRDSSRKIAMPAPDAYADTYTNN